MIKKTLLFLSIFFAFNSFGQDARKNAVKFGSSGLSYERAISNRSSLVFSVPTNISLSSNGVTDFAIGFGGDYRLHLSPNKSNLAGFYLSPGILGVKGSLYIYDLYSSKRIPYTVLGSRLIGGYQWVFRRGFILDLSGGGIYRSKRYPGAYSLYNDNKFAPTFGFSLGYAF